MITCEVRYPTTKIGRVTCKHDVGRWYELSLYIDDELVDYRAHWCLDIVQFGNRYVVAEDILNAFRLSGDIYSIHEPSFRDIHILVQRGLDFTVDVWQSAIIN